MYIYTLLCRYWIALYRYVLVVIVPHVDIELEDNKQFISNIPRSIVRSSVLLWSGSRRSYFLGLRWLRLCRRWYGWSDCRTRRLCRSRQARLNFLAMMYVPSWRVCRPWRISSSKDVAYSDQGTKWNIFVSAETSLRRRLTRFAVSFTKFTLSTSGFNGTVFNHPLCRIGRIPLMATCAVGFFLCRCSYCRWNVRMTVVENVVDPRKQYNDLHYKAN